MEKMFYILCSIVKNSESDQIKRNRKTVQNEFVAKGRLQMSHKYRIK